MKYTENMFVDSWVSFMNIITKSVDPFSAKLYEWKKNLWIHFHVCVYFCVDLLNKEAIAAFDLIR